MKRVGEGWRIDGVQERLAAGRIVTKNHSVNVFCRPVIRAGEVEINLFKCDFQEDTMMGLFSKLFQGPEPDMEKSAANAKKVRALFDQAVEHGEDYRLIVGYTEDVQRFNYGFVHGSKTQIGNLIVGWNEAANTIAVVPTVPDLSGYGDPTYYRREEIHKAYRNKYPTDAFIIYPDRKGYIGINAYEWLEDESLYIYLYQKEELEAFTAFFQNTLSTK
ncbi:MAG: hypothetical protein ACOX64_14350 [Candidatus Merdivicinus sp.]